MMLNISVLFSDSIYLLVRIPLQGAEEAEQDFAICQMRGYLSADCASHYNVTTAGRSIRSSCEVNDDMTYARQYPALEATRSYSYREVLPTWATMLTLDDNVDPEAGRLQRMLAQFVMRTQPWGSIEYSPLLPTLAEALSVLSCSMLIQSTIQSTTSHQWLYANEMLSPPTWEAFNVSMKSQQQASGTTRDWQSVFFLVLILVSVGNCGCLNSSSRIRIC